MAEAPFDAISSAANFAKYITTTWLESFQVICGIIGKQGIESPMQQKVGIRKLINTVNHPHTFSSGNSKKGARNNRIMHLAVGQ